MKVLIIKKKLIVNLLFSTVLLLLALTIFYLTITKFKTVQVIYPINMSGDMKYDLTGNGNEDIIEMVNGQNQVDFNIKCNDSNNYLSKLTDDKVLFTFNNHWIPKFYVHDLSRDNIPEIIVQGSKNNKSLYYIFNWNNEKFAKIYSSEKNIFGILDCKNTKTPQCYSISSSSGIASLNSFMIINNEIVDTTKENPSVPSLDSTIKFIDLIEAPYEPDEIPDLFNNSIAKKDLSLLWNLDKDNFSYAFQDAFFYDYEWDSFGIPKAIKWRLSFEKNNLKGSNGDKSELILFLDLRKENSVFKITSIQKSK